MITKTFVRSIVLAVYVLFCLSVSLNDPMSTDKSVPTQTYTYTGPIVIRTPEINIVPTKTPVIVKPAPTPVPPIYKVRSGDTLQKIADMFGVPLGYLADQNQIYNPNLIQVDQMIKRPPWPPLPDEKGKQIIVVLSSQQVFVYEDGKLLKTFLVSTGTADHRTVVGNFKIWIKLKSTPMSGPGYYLPDVPNTMYFYKDYGLHGTYWHNNFGHPMSHGCVNLSIVDAEWLFNWAEVGTPVKVTE